MKELCTMQYNFELTINKYYRLLLGFSKIAINKTLKEITEHWTVQFQSLKVMLNLEF